MANFNTHFAAGSFVAGMSASLCYFAGWCDLGMSLGLWAAGAIGSLLPDIDVDDNTASKAFFNFLAFIVMGLTLYWLSSNQWGMWTSWLFLGLIYFIIRFPLMLFFQKFTQHRGVLHSVLGAVFFAFITILLASWTLKLSHTNSWLLGLFLGMGYLLHLALDETFAVDLMNVKLKRSFGTALKLFSVERWGRSAVMAVFVFAMIWFLPPLNIQMESMETMVRKVDPRWFNEEYVRTSIEMEVEQAKEPVLSYWEEAKAFWEEHKISLPKRGGEEGE